MVTLKVVARRRAKQDELRATQPKLPTELSRLGQMHMQALALHDQKHLHCRQGQDDDSDVITSSGHVLLEMQTDESIIAMNQRLIRERDALVREQEVWQAQLQHQHTNLQEVLQATRLLKLKMQHNPSSSDESSAVVGPSPTISPTLTL